VGCTGKVHRGRSGGSKGTRKARGYTGLSV
jgi:hypothetical protein